MRFALLALAALPLLAQTPMSNPGPGPDHRGDQILKSIDNYMWHLKLGDIAHVDQVTYTSTPPHYEANPTGQGAGNGMIVFAYTFIPKALDRSRKHPSLVYVHGGVHSNLQSGGSANGAHIIRELLELGYTVIAPDYRGSTGYGAGYYNRIDYGGRENDDVHAARAWLLERYNFLDPARVGILGWSHGGMITLMTIFQHPKDYAVAYAGVPVSDLVARLGYKSESYRKVFSAKSHIGKTVEEDVQAYLKRSPFTYAAKLETPLWIDGNTNDEDVNVLEVRRMIDAFKAAGKKFESKIWEAAPGGHHFNRIDTKLARDSRAEIWRFLGQHLKP
jgi:dipeptidyl aminopeptidase/acylaminoacyl peptidase